MIESPNASTCSDPARTVAPADGAERSVVPLGSATRLATSYVNRPPTVSESEKLVVVVVPRSMPLRRTTYVGCQLGAAGQLSCTPTAPRDFWVAVSPAGASSAGIVTVTTLLCCIFTLL